MHYTTVTNCKLKFTTQKSLLPGLHLLTIHNIRWLLLRDRAACRLPFFWQTKKEKKSNNDKMTTEKSYSKENL